MMNKKKLYGKNKIKKKNFDESNHFDDIQFFLFPAQHDSFSFILFYFSYLFIYSFLLFFRFVSFETIDPCQFHVQQTQSQFT